MVPVADSSSVMVMGTGRVALFDAANQHVLWETRLEHEGGKYPRQMVEPNTEVKPVAGTISTVTRQQLEDDKWQISVVMLNVESGSVIRKIPLVITPKRNFALTRHIHEGDELLSIDQRVYRIKAK